MEQMLLNGEKSINHWTFSKRKMFFFSYRSELEITNKRVLMSKKSNFPKKVDESWSTKVSDIFGTRLIINYGPTWSVLVAQGLLSIVIWTVLALAAGLEESSPIAGIILGIITFFVLVLRKQMIGMGISSIEVGMPSNYGKKSLAIEMKTEDIVEIDKAIHQFIV